MDATKKPLKISPELVNYAEKHKIFENMKQILELLIIDRPTDPIAYLIDYLKKDIDEVPRIFILGPPASGKRTLAKMLSGRLRCVLLTPENVFSECELDIKDVAENCLSENRDIPSNVWSRGLHQRMRMIDCARSGFILANYPETREQVHALQCEGVFPTHVISLQAPDHVLVERASGKRVDPDTGDVYHVSFDPAPDVLLADSLVCPPECSPDRMAYRLAQFHRNFALVRPLYEHVLHEINADQPIADILQTAMEVSVTRVRLPALRTPRIVLLGPPGSGKRTIASLICKKYGLMNINCGDLIREAIADENKHGLAMRSFVDKNIPVPDFVLIQLIEEKLTNLCCSVYGWLLHGYPLNVKQAENLDCFKLQPNRVFVLEVPTFVSLERICERRVDPVTGDRFHVTYNPPASHSSSTRAVRHPDDEVKIVKRKLGRYSTTIAELKDYYKEHIVIDANQDLHNVFELVESYLVNPLPMKLE